MQTQTAHQIVQYHGGTFVGHNATGFDNARLARDAASELQQDNYRCGTIKRTASGYQFTVSEYRAPARSFGRSV